jgi:hypothetical protein
MQVIDFAPGTFIWRPNYYAHLPRWSALLELLLLFPFRELTLYECEKAFPVLNTERKKTLQLSLLMPTQPGILADAEWTNCKHRIKAREPKPPTNESK